MGSYSVSLDKTSERKMDAIKASIPKYAGQTNGEIINSLVSEFLEPVVLKED